ARFWNHVPLADAALPTKYGPKLRVRISRAAAAGPCGVSATPGLVELRVDAARNGSGDAGHALELFLRRRRHLLDRAEVLQQCAAARRADALEVVEERREAARLAPLPVE